jgi:HEAT repeat protein
MLRLERWAKLTFFVLILAAGIHTEITLAEIGGLGEDSWHTWQVQAVEGAPEMCCFSWRSGSATRKQCNLDGRNGGFNSSNDSATSAESVQVFALMKAGVATRIRVLSTSCPVSADSEITDLGPIEADDSVDWLEQFIPGGDDSGSDAIAAIAVHEGRKARNVLLDTAKPGNDQDTREEAIFWMAQVRLDETAADLRKFIFDDENTDIREHAAFAYSQSSAADVSDVLIQQGRNDDDPDVRSQAWFWLAQSEADESEAAIHDALLNDRNEDVREEAVFALSQLPEDRAVKALASILEDRQLSMDIREQALFWLAQTESDEAFEYIDRLLSDN